MELMALATRFFARSCTGIRSCPCYLDVVVQGFLREFGEAGAQRFFETTDGWEVGIVNDRAAPLYPRHRVLSAEERAFVDGAIAVRAIRVGTL